MQRVPDFILTPAVGGRAPHYSRLTLILQTGLQEKELAHSHTAGGATTACSQPCPVPVARLLTMGVSGGGMTVGSICCLIWGLMA